MGMTPDGCKMLLVRARGAFAQHYGIQKRGVRVITPRHTTTIRGTIYTVGYALPDAAAWLDRLMRDPRALLVDIRSQPRSRPWPQCNRAALSARYSRRYVWERRLGNIHYREPGAGHYFFQKDTRTPSRRQPHSSVKEPSLSSCAPAPTRGPVTAT